MKFIRKLALQLAMASYTPVNFYLSLPLREMGEYADAIAEINKQ